MVDKRMTIADMIARIHNGAKIVIGGWGPFRKPMALLRGIVRSNLKDLTIMSFPAMDFDLLIGSGKVKKVIYPCIALEGAPISVQNFRRARQEASIDFMEISEYMFICGFKATAERLPFYPTRSGLGSDMLTMNPDIEIINAPYTGEKLVAMPAIEPDIALIHTNAADIEGNAQILGDPFLDPLYLRAAKKVFLSCEKVLSSSQLRKDPANVVIKSLYVTGVIEIPYGAHPVACYPDYGWDEAHLREYSESSVDPEAFRNYLDKYVHRIEDQADYIQLVGGTTKLAELRGG